VFDGYPETMHPSQNVPWPSFFDGFLKGSYCCCDGGSRLRDDLDGLALLGDSRVPATCERPGIFASAELP
jgi:hypothetical protein